MNFLLSIGFTTDFFITFDNFILKYQNSFFSFFFFHCGVFHNYFLFIWFLKLRFLLFSPDYYFFYLFFFSMFFFIRTFSNLDLKKDPSSFFPYIWRISDKNVMPFNFDQIYPNNFDEDWYEDIFESVVRDMRRSAIKNSNSGVDFNNLRFQWPFLKGNFGSNTYHDLNLSNKSEVENFVSSYKSVDTKVFPIKSKFSYSLPKTKALFLRSSKALKPFFSMFLSDKVLLGQNPLSRDTYNVLNVEKEKGKSKKLRNSRSKFWSRFLNSSTDQNQYVNYKPSDSPVLGFQSKLSRLHYVVDLPSDGRLGSRFSNSFSKFYKRPVLFPSNDKTYFVFNSENVPDTFDEFLRFFSEKLYSSYKVELGNNKSLYVDPEYVKLLVVFNRLRKLKFLHRRLYNRGLWSLSIDKLSNQYPLYYNFREPGGKNISKGPFYLFYQPDRIRYWSYVAFSDIARDSGSFLTSTFGFNFIKILYNYVYLFFIS